MLDHWSTFSKHGPPLAAKVGPGVHFWLLKLDWGSTFGQVQFSRDRHARQNGPPPSEVMYVLHLLRGRFVSPTFLKMDEGSAQGLPPVRVLKKVYGRLFQAIHSPDLLAGFMYSEELIGDEIVGDLPSISSSQARTKLLSAFSATLGGSDRQDNVMERMCRALEATGEPALKDIASDIRLLCRGLFVVGHCTVYM